MRASVSRRLPRKNRGAGAIFRGINAIGDDVERIF